LHDLYDNQVELYSFSKKALSFTTIGQNIYIYGFIDIISRKFSVYNIV